MDKKSAALICAICAMLCISTAVVYTTWFAEKGYAAAVSREQIEEEMELAQIAMNMDAQVINGGCQDMWVRAKVRQVNAKTDSDKNTNSNQESERNIDEWVSETIAKDAAEKEKKEGVWILEQDGYYYYSKPIPPGEQSKPLFQTEEGQAQASDFPEWIGENGHIRVQAEGVQINWTGKKAQNGKEAFELFRLQKPLEEYKGTFV